jgi:glucose 1-dehydrogenase
VSGYSISLAGRKALITGSSRGIGRAIALGLADAGAQIHLHASKPGPELSEVLAEAEGATAYPADLADSEAVAGLIASAGEVDILVLNAAMQIRKDWESVDRADIDAQVSVNLAANLQLLQALVPSMRRKGWGRVLFVGSIQSRRPHPQMPIYAMLKSGLENLMRNLARDLAPEGIAVNMISPGVFPTDRNAEALSDPGYRDRVLAQIPMGRFGKPQDCAGAAILLCSDAAGFITGTDLAINGGGHLV